MHDKCTSTLPPIRVSEALELKLSRMAARDDRKLSDYVRWALTLHVEGHGHMLDVGGNDDNEDHAKHCDARRCGWRQ